jgi:5-methylcytosine-specific restriction endonuclease McrA
MYYGDHKGMIFNIGQVALFPVSMVRHKPPMCFSQNICNYTPEGRRKIHDNLQGVNMETLHYLMENPVLGESSEYNDNRVSLYAGQLGKCGATKIRLTIGNMEAHHIIPRKMGGTDAYGNLIFLCTTAHKLVHAVETTVIDKYLTALKPDKTAISKINKLRQKVGNCEIACK